MKIIFLECDIFANIVNEIQDMIDILNDIFYKGYFEEITYKIKIKYGKCFVNKNNNYIKKYNLKNLKDILKELNNIKENQNIIIQDIYKNKAITRLINGRQFEFIYLKCI